MDTMNIAIVGDAGVGKTTYIMKQITGVFVRVHNHNPHSQFKVAFYTNRGNIVFNIIEGLDEKEPLDGIMIMFDRTNYQSFISSLSMVHNLCSKYPNIPIILLGNKVDFRYEAIEYMQIAMECRPLFSMYDNLRYYDISAKSNYNFEKPFLHMIRTYYSDHKCSLTEFPADVSTLIKN